jgi:hypothetical protein
VEQYRAFLAAYPRGPFVSEASKRLVELSFVEAQNAHTVAALRAFLDEFPNTPFSAEAAKGLEDLSYKEAQTAGTPQAFAAFLEKFPAGTLAGKARAEKEDLERRLAVRIVKDNKLIVLSFEFLMRAGLEAALSSKSTRASALLDNPRPRLPEIIQQYGEPTRVTTIPKGTRSDVLAGNDLKKNYQVHWYGRLQLLVAEDSAEKRVEWMLVDAQ